MGQQQILLLLLVSIIIGVATIVAINTMLQARQEANYDTIRQKMMEASTLAQSYYRKNKMLGGGGGSYQEITLQHLNIQSNEDNLGEFSLDPGEDSFMLSAIPASGGNIVVSVIYPDRIEFVSSEESDE